MTSLEREREREAIRFARAWDDPSTRLKANLWVLRGAIELVVAFGAMWLIEATDFADGAGEVVAVTAGIVGIITTFVSARAWLTLHRYPWRPKGLKTGISLLANGGLVVRFNDEPGRCFVVNEFRAPASDSELNYASRWLVAGTGRARVIASMDRRWMRSVARPRVRWLERRMWNGVTR